MKFNLSVELDDQLLRDLQQHFDIGAAVVRQDLQAALERTVEIYERDVERKKAESTKNKLRNSGG